MLKNLENYLRKKLKEFSKEKEIVDIVLFGSIVKGKEFPRDIDICIIFRKEINKDIINKINEKLKNINVSIHISSLLVDEFFRKPHSLAKTILVEGKSLLTEKKLAENLGLSSKIIYAYNLSKLKASDKVRFVYLLKGRKEKKQGFIEKIRGEWLTDSCFIIPIEKDNEIISILKKWKVDYIRKEALIH